jgi:uncharacterized protein (DUF433 family)
MSLPILAADPLPLADDGKGGLRVGKSRIPLELVIEAFDAGQSPDAIVLAYDSLELADVYAIAAYYLRHADVVRDYVRQRKDDERAIEQRVRELPTSNDGLREKLAARKGA